MAAVAAATATLTGSATLAASLFSQSAKDKKALKTLGQNMEKAEKVFRDLAQNPNATPAQLKAASMDVEKASQAFEAFVALKSATGKLLQRIIDSLRALGN
ncbi:MAG: hypothetical protein RL417_741 [Pseudomonadota bacterium]